MLDSWKTILNETSGQSLHFEQAAMNLEQTQHQLLKDVLNKNSGATYAKKYKFSQIDNVIDYQKTVPIVTYDDIEHHIDAQSQGNHALCAEPVLFYEPTGGSSAGLKIIPYTQSSLNALQAAINPWLHNLTDSRPGISKGKSYWSICPATRAPTQTADGTPIGAPSDLAFLSPSIQAAFVDLFAVPTELATITAIDNWRYFTLFALISNPKLSLISVWNPSFLTLLIQAIPEYRDRLINDLNNKGATTDSVVWNSISSSCDPTETKKRFELATNNGTLNTSLLWPALDTISCWTHGAANQSMPELLSQFPQCHIQAKGLLATEAVVSIPHSKSDYPVLAARSAFFEFRDSHDQIKLAHELNVDQQYEVIVTTHGGLYRYALGDIVRIKGHYRELPTLEFIGRNALTSDRFGEKLTDAFVAKCIRDIPGFSMIAPKKESRDFSYQLFVDEASVSQADAQNLVAQVEQKLGSNPHYDYARKLKQISPLKVIRLRSPEQQYLDYCYKRQLLGDIKPIALCTDPSLVDHLLSSRVP